MATRHSPFLYFLMLTLLFGCAKKSPEGLFYNKRDWEKKRYIELKSDGTFFLKQQRQVVGKFEAEEGGITLIFEGGQADRWQTKGDTLVGGSDTYILWAGGKNGFQFEQKVDEVLSQFQKTNNSLIEGKITQQQADKEQFDIIVMEGFISREEADKEIDRRRPGGKEDIINDLNNLVAYAYQYRIRPHSMGGGQGSYIGYSIPLQLASNKNGTYSASVFADYIIFTGTSSYRQGSVSAKADKDGHLSAWEYAGNFK